MDSILVVNAGSSSVVNSGTITAAGGNGIVFNAGSSSIKFSLFGENGADLSVFLKGQIEGLYTDGTHFAAHDVDYSGHDLVLSCVARRGPGASYTARKEM